VHVPIAMAIMGMAVWLSLRAARRPAPAPAPDSTD